ncbi:MAG: DUF4124 domain-containing protein [Alcanivorax sp.]|nr:DUF4124 domain-containing protein [Alcanivorax sp.]
MTIRLTLLLLVALPLLAQGQIYRWKDAHGHWQFSEQAPADKPHETVTVTPPAKIGQGQEVKQIQQRLDRLRESEKLKAQHEAQKKRMDAQHLHQPCEKARKRLRTLKRPFVYVDKEGNRRGASADEVRADITRTEKWIRENCDS